MVKLMYSEKRKRARKKIKKDATRLDALFIEQQKAPVPVHLLVIWLADLKAKPVANQENAHPMQDW